MSRTLYTDRPPPIAMGGNPEEHRRQIVDALAEIYDGFSIALSNYRGPNGNWVEIPLIVSGQLTFLGTFDPTIDGGSPSPDDGEGSIQNSDTREAGSYFVARAAGTYDFTTGTTGSGTTFSIGDWAAKTESGEWVKLEDIVTAISTLTAETGLPTTSDTVAIQGSGGIATSSTATSVTVDGTQIQNLANTKVASLEAEGDTKTTTTAIVIKGAGGIALTSDTVSVTIDGSNVRPIPGQTGWVLVADPTNTGGFGNGIFADDGLRYAWPFRGFRFIDREVSIERTDADPDYLKFFNTNITAAAQFWRFSLENTATLRLQLGDNTTFANAISFFSDGVSTPNRVLIGANTLQASPGAANNVGFRLGGFAGVGLFGAEGIGAVHYSKFAASRGEIMTRDHTQAAGGMDTPLRLKVYDDAAALPPAASWDGAIAFDSEYGDVVWSDGTKWKTSSISLRARSIIRLGSDFSLADVLNWERVEGNGLWQAVEDTEGLWDSVNSWWDLSVIPTATAFAISFQVDVENTANQATGAAAGLGISENNGGTSFLTPENTEIEVIDGGQVPRRQDFPYTILGRRSPLIAVDFADTKIALFGWAASLNDIDFLGGAGNNATWMDIEVYV